MGYDFGKITKHSLKEVFSKENAFRDWLVENIPLLNDLFHLDFQVEGTEVPVDRLRVDILASFNPDDDYEAKYFAAIEIQLGQSDSKHLGQLITYGAQHDARYCIWIAEEFKPGHLSTLEILNEMGTDSDRTYFAVKAELFSIEESRKVVNLKFDHKAIELPIINQTRKRSKNGTEQFDLMFTFYDELRNRMTKFPWFTLNYLTSARYYQFDCVRTENFDIQVGWRFRGYGEYALLIDMRKKDREIDHNQRLSTKAFHKLIEHLNEEYHSNKITVQEKPTMSTNKLYIAFPKKVEISDLADEKLYTELLEWSVSEMEKFYGVVKSFGDKF